MLNRHTDPDISMSFRDGGLKIGTEVLLGVFRNRVQKLFAKYYREKFWGVPHHAHPFFDVFAHFKFFEKKIFYGGEWAWSTHDLASTIFRRFGNFLEKHFFFSISLSPTGNGAEMNVFPCSTLDLTLERSRDVNQTNFF
jgi:hypothetical protein